MPTYEITAPNGKTLEIDGAQMPTEAELHDIFAKAGVESGAKPSAQVSDPNTLGTFAKHAAQQVNPVPLGQVLPFPQALGGGGWDAPIHAAKHILQAQGEVFDRAKQSYEKGDYVGAAAHALHWLLPVIGPQLDKAGNELREGKTMAGLGDTAGIAGALVGPKALPEVVAAAPEAAQVARGPVGRAVAATGRGVEAVGNSRAAGLAEKAGGVEAAWHMDPKGAAVALAPSALRVTGRGMQRLGKAIEGATPEAGAAAAPVALAPDPILQPQGRGAGPRTINEAMEEAQRIARERATTSPAASQPAGRTPPAASAPVTPERPPTATATPNPAAGAKPKLSAAEFGAESRTYAQLRRMGKTDTEAVEAIAAMRRLNGGRLPTDAEVRAAVQARNATGRWQ